MLLSVDAGNWNTKVAWENGCGLFDSCLGEGRKRNLESKYEDEMIIKYDGQYMFAGMLAEYESIFPRRSFGLSKAHDDMKVRVLIAISKYGKGDIFDLMVGQPIKKHDEYSKGMIKKLLLGEHKIEVNGVERIFNINSVNVGAEGAIIYWTLESHEQVVRIVDIGSGTINIATIRDGYFIDKESTTLPFGTSRAEKDIEIISNSVNSALTSICDTYDKIYVCGGVGEIITPLIQQQYPNAIAHNPKFQIDNKIEELSPQFANVVGLYNLGTVIHS